MNPMKFRSPGFSIQHPKGNIVIDGGNAVECVRDPYAYWGSITDMYYPVMTEEQGCVNELARLGIDPGSISFVLFSHLHPGPLTRPSILPDRPAEKRDHSLDHRRGLYP
jgi:N-acyl homoserine lactone hydrolase